jgi:H2-forming N5,N10-methylenetetrahydromethanopterin dehydrogenase-like enzyme
VDAEAEAAMSEWTTDTVLQHLLELRKADTLAVQNALAVANQARDKADLAIEKRFESVNEFRNALKDQQGTYITRNEVYALVASIGTLVTILALLFALVGHFVH